ncbi:cyclic nucleotide-binding domain-containing protein [Pannonibacter sp. Pt2]|uniref:Cyclic nucleotide-binding domain-containing protein n=1 Tax=Pannonibacter anstelovis TaxID=3121537 RepID=A0ABU7ZMF8_9HYPH
MKTAYLDEIRQLDLFHSMQDENFEAVMRGAYVQSFPPLVDLIHEGDGSDFLHVIIDGSVELYATWSGKETTISIVRPVSTFILAATIRNAPYLMSAKTLERSRIVMLPSEDVRRIFDADSGFARAVVRELATCYRASIKHTKTLKLRTSLERLANYILQESAARNGVDAYVLDLEKRKLASLLGMTPENMSRAIKALSPYGVHIDGSRVVIENRAELERFARPAPLIDDPSS